MQLECLGTKIAIVRRARGFSDADLANKTGHTARYISDIQEGKFQPTVRLLCDIATTLECSIDYLLGNEFTFSVPGLNDEEDK